MRLGNEHAGQAHFGELRPQVAREAGRVGAVAQFAQVRHRRLFGDEGGDAVLEHRLVVIVVEWHVLSQSVSRHPSESWDSALRSREPPCPDSGPSLRWGERDFFYAPGKSRIRLAITLSMTSLVPPSIELALVRSQPRARAPPLVSSLSHSSASLPPPDMTSS